MLKHSYINVYEKRLKTKSLLLSLLGGVCVNCLSTENLQFDHVFPEEKSFHITSNLSASLEKLLKELQKCQLLCSFCHREKSNQEINDKPKVVRAHGTSDSYINGNCRCESCRHANTLYHKNRRKLFTSVSVYDTLNI